MTIAEAAEKGISALRKSYWASPQAHVKIDLFTIGDGSVKHGPWGHLYDEAMQRALREPTPQNFLLLGDSEDDWEEYKPAEAKEGTQ